MRTRSGFAINDGVDSAQGENDFAPLRNIFNEWLVRDTSKKIRAVKRSKGMSGKPVTSKPVYGYLMDEDENFIIDEEAAPVVKQIYSLCLAGNGPTKIARMLTEQEIPTPGTLEYRRTGSTRRYENDIPMQKKACHDFADRQEGWTILKEFSEKGVSRYKVSAKDRDAIQELKEAAQKKEFDILLVFMFDRIGRIDDETPFVVEWFAKHGIEGWSTQEGQQCFNSHVDKLMNYLRFWQASGESEKTSIRIWNKMQQMMLEGLYTGGPIRFGYHLVDSGLVNRKGAKIRKYEIDPAEREVLHMIDDMTVHKGYGSYRMADFLNKKWLSAERWRNVYEHQGEPHPA